MTPTMTEHKLIRAFENGLLSKPEVAIWEPYEKEGEIESRLRRKVSNSVVVGLSFTVKREFLFVLKPGQLLPVYKGDVIEISKTEANNPTGISFIFNHLPAGTKYRRMESDFASIRTIHLDA